MPRGKLIVLYGINNLGKTTQAKLLVEKLNQKGCQAKYLKYPLYNLEPFGPMINAYMREGNPLNLSAREFQIIQVLNRTQYQPTLELDLSSGKIVVAEDYIGTGIAWGMGAGVDKGFLVQINQHLLKEDLAFLFEGERFSEAIEAGHHHEQNNELTERTRLAHQDLGLELGWLKINSNQSREEIADQVWDLVQIIL